MPPPDDHSNSPESDPDRHQRRPRYRGTHPRRFDQRYKELAPETDEALHEHVLAQGRTPAGTHVPVMLREVLEALAPTPGSTVADCTIGYGGHAEAFLKAIHPGGVLIGLDVDGVELERTRVRLSACTAHEDEASGSGLGLQCDGESDTSSLAPTLHFHRSHFAGLPKVLEREGIPAVDVILADLGVSSMQIDDPSRGFSYKDDGPLDMRMDDRLHRTAADLIATLSEDELADSLRELSDESHAMRIASAVTTHRNVEPIRTTLQLVRLIFEATGTSRRKWRDQVDDGVHPAARTFQALRMLVNDEAAGLDQFLRVASYCLNPGGRIGIISFHSGEDRRVKHVFRDGLGSGLFEAICDEVIRPSAVEVSSNPRSRSAKLRWARRARA